MGRQTLLPSTIILQYCYAFGLECSDVGNGALVVISMENYILYAAVPPLDKLGGRPFVVGEDIKFRYTRPKPYDGYTQHSKWLQPVGDLLATMCNPE